MLVPPFFYGALDASFMSFGALDAHFLMVLSMLWCSFYGALDALVLILWCSRCSGARVLDAGAHFIGALNVLVFILREISSGKKKRPLLDPQTNYGC